MSDCPEIFKNTGDAFSGWNAAKAWLRENCGLSLEFDHDEQFDISEDS